MSTIAQFIFGFTVSFVAILAVALVARARGGGACPRCATVLPLIRKPASLREALLGGWTCPSCGCQGDRKGHQLAA